jgi:hypothetical protein
VSTDWIVAGAMEQARKFVLWVAVVAIVVGGALASVPWVLWWALR